MPTYVYECKQCHHAFEIEQRITEDPLKDCGECGGTIRRIIQPVGIAFKGSGFYVNDSVSKPTQTKADTKPEAKPETPAAPETPATPAPAPATETKADPA